MDFENFLCKNTEWRFTNRMIFYKKMAWIPFASFKKNDYLEIYLEPRNSKPIIKLIKNWKKSQDFQFHFISPLFSDPHFFRTMGTDETHKVNIENYLKNYAKEEFFDGFEKIDFNLIENLLLYTQKTDSFSKLKEIYNKTNDEVQYKYYDYYRKSQVYSVKREDIRQSFSNLWRDIQIQNLFK